MSKVTAEMVKELRELTGVSIGKCKEALEQAHGDIKEAIAVLRKAGIASAVKKEGRETNEGVIKTSDNGKKLALIEIRAETDFVVKNERFQEFAQNLCDEVSAQSPVTVEEFLKMPYSKNPKLTIDEYRAEIIQSLGENIQIGRFELFEKKKDSSIAVYSHGAGKLVTMVEITGTPDAVDLAKDIAMHVAAESPEYLTETEIPQRVKDHETEIAKAQVKDKPDHITDKIVQGKLNAYFDQVCLLRQKFIKDPSKTIQQLIDQLAKDTGKQVKLSYFLRWKVGEK